MSKANNKSNADKHAEAKRKGDKPPDDWGKTIGNSLQSLHHGSWIQNFVVGFAILLIGPAIAFLMNNKQGIVYGAAGGVSILIWIFAIAIAREINKTPGEKDAADSKASRPVAKDASKVPWISINDPFFDVPNNRLTYNIYNDSDFPAFITGMATEYVSKDPTFQVNMLPDDKPKRVFVPPHKVMQATTNPDLRATPIEIIKGVFFAGRVSMKITVRFEDSTNNKYTLVVVIDPQPNGVEQFKLTSAEITGLDQPK